MPGRVARIALVVWVAALLVLPVAGYALGFRGKNIDNRTLAKGPGWSLHTLTHSSAWHHAADAFSDHMPLRDRAIRWRAETEFDVFHDSPRPDDVIVGRDGWLFLHEEFDTCTLYPDRHAAAGRAGVRTRARGRQGQRARAVHDAGPGEVDDRVGSLPRLAVHLRGVPARARAGARAADAPGNPASIDLWERVPRGEASRGRSLDRERLAHSTCGARSCSRRRSCRRCGPRPGRRASSRWVRPPPRSATSTCSRASRTPGPTTASSCTER